MSALVKRLQALQRERYELIEELETFKLENGDELLFREGIQGCINIINDRSNKSDNDDSIPAPSLTVVGSLQQIADALREVAQAINNHGE